MCQTIKILPKLGFLFLILISVNSTADDIKNTSHASAFTQDNDQGYPLLSGLKTEFQSSHSLDNSISNIQNIEPGKTPEGLEKTEWQSIQSQIEGGKYNAYITDKGGYKSANPNNGWHINYDSDGTTTLSPYKTVDEDFHIALRLDTVFYQDLGGTAENPINNLSFEKPSRISFADNRLNYHWDNNITEYWINSPQKLEQWFEIKQRPTPHSTVSLLKNQLQVQMTLDTNLDVSLKNNRLNIGDITYDQLKVWDATGQIITANLNLQGKHLNILVDDKNAIYPLTIDPSFTQQAYIKASNPGESDEFGLAVSISGDTLVVGALKEDSNATGVNGNQSNNSTNSSGAAYVFIRNGSTWTQQAYLKASNTNAADNFGEVVSISGDTVVVGARREKSNATGVNGNENNNSLLAAGAAYVFIRNGSTWTQQAYLKASNTGFGDFFGKDVSISGNTIVVGAIYESSNATGVNGDEFNNDTFNSGAAYVFVRSGTTWTQQAYLKASNSSVANFFGEAVSISGNTIVVGAHQESTTEIKSGAAYVFVRNGSTWTQQAYLKASNPGSSNLFGITVSISGDTLVVGAYGEASNATGVNGDQNNTSAPDSGAAYVFVRTGTTWSQQAYLKASNTDGGDFFGHSVSISDNTLVVGAPLERSNATGVNGDQNNNLAHSSGAAYVFVRNGTTWTQQDYLKASNADIGDNFGFAVSISGNSVVVGAFGEDNLEFNSGATYVFALQETYLVSGTVSGYSGSGLQLQNGGETITVTGNNFAFIDPVIDGTSYAVSVATQPNSPPQTCSVTNNGSGTSTVNVTNVQVTCVTDTYLVSGTVTGYTGSGLQLTNNSQTITVSGSNFAFSSPVVDGTNYAVSVATQPSSPPQTCTVTNNGSGTSNIDVTNVAVTCVTNTYLVSGTVSGYTGSGLQLTNNSQTITVSGNSFAFSNPVVDGTNYAVSVATQPSSPSQTCSVTNNGSGNSTSDVTNVRVNCTTNTFTVGGTVTGATGPVTVLNNTASSVIVPLNGAFSFIPRLDGINYSISIGSSPATQTCTVANGSGTLNGADVTDVAVTCVTDTYLVSGTVTGYTGSGLQLTNNSETITVSGNSFAFSTPVVVGASYSVSVATQPSSPPQTCTVTANGSGNSTVNVTNVQITCVTDTYLVSGTVTGYTGSGLQLTNNTETINVVGNGFSFADANIDGTNYAVSVATQPNSPPQTCTVTANGSGNSTVDVTNVQITCVTDMYLVSGTVTGYTGSGLQLTNNAETITVSGNNFSFSNPVVDGTSYAVSVATQPSSPSQTCSITANGSGTSTIDVTNITVSCSTNTFTIGGTVTGLVGSGLTLQNNAGDDLSISADGVFIFSTDLDDLSAYVVTVLAQPTNLSQVCTVALGSGSLAGVNITDVAITCSTSSFTVGGMVTNLVGSGLTLQNNVGDDVSISTDGVFTFTTALTDGSAYEVAVLNQPNTPNQVCSITDNSGNLAGANVTNVSVDCVTDTHTVAGTITGLATGNSVVLQNNGADDLTVGADGNFIFSTVLDDGSAYAVTVSTQATVPSQTCTVSNGSGTLTGADVTNVSVSCVTDTFTVGGTVSGLATGNSNSVTLINNGGNDLTLNGNGSFTFATAFGDGLAYAVTVFTQPNSPNQVCTITNGSGNLAGINVTDIMVNCINDTRTVGGMVSGLAGSGLTLQNNNGDDLTVNANGSFTFNTALSAGSVYLVTVLEQPTSPNQICTVTNNSGTLAGTDATDVIVNCVTETYFIGGMLTGMMTTNNLMLDNNFQETELVRCNGPFVFNTPLADLSSYSVIELIGPESPLQDCTITHGDGIVNGDHVIDILVSCAVTTDTGFIFGDGFDCPGFIQ